MKGKTILFIISILTFTNTSYGQGEVEVTDQTIKIGGMKDEELLFGFATGDKVIFNFTEKDKNELKEVEIIEYPDNSKFSDFKTTKIENKTFNVQKTGVYIFRFKNSSIKGRVCRIQIHRIPKSEEYINFNTSVRWVDTQDTSFNSYTKDVVIGYDTTYQLRTKIELVKTETNEELILDKSQRVHSQTNGNGNKTSVFFTLPTNEISPYKTKKVIAWAYWVGVDEAGNQAWEQNSKTISNLTKGVASIYLTPLGALAVGAVTDLMIPSIGEDVSYWYVNQQNNNLFFAGQPFNCFDKGKGVAGYRKFTDKALLQGPGFICLLNDNYMQGINVNIKIVAIIETNYFEDKQYLEPAIMPRVEKQILKDPIITPKRIPITGQ